MDLIQTGGKVKRSVRISETSPVDTRLGDEGDDDTRIGRRVIEGDGLGHFNGTRAAFSGRERNYHREVQEETQSDSSNLFGAGRRSDQEWASDRELSRPNVSPPVTGLVYRAAFCPVSSIRALLKGLHFHEPTCSKPKDKVLELGLCQNLISKSLMKSASSATIFGSPEEGREGNAINLGEGAELREVVVQEDGYNPMNNHGLEPGCLSSSRSKDLSQDKARTPSFWNKDRAKDPLLSSDEERYYPSMPLSSSTSSPCLDRTPLLGESFGHGSHDEIPQASEDCVGSQGIALAPLAILPPSSSTRPLCRDLVAVEEREVQQCKDGDKDENRGKEFLAEDTESWEESCLARFSKFLGFSTTGHEEEILEFLKRFNVGRKRGKGKGGDKITKFDREMKKLAWNVTDMIRKKDGGLGKEVKAHYYSR